MSNLNTVIGSNGTSGYITSGTSFVNNTINPVLSVRDDNLTVDPKATLEVKGKMVLNGLDLEERLKTIEYVLGLPERDAKIEAKYPSLKKKYDEYVKALGKYRTFEALKGDNNGTT